MADVKWIKITTDIFDDEKILLIEALPEADSIIVIWFKLLCLAGKINNSGVFLLNDKIAYTDKMLASIFRRKEATVKLALETFENFGMIELVDDVITIPNWDKHQNLDQLEKKREYMREYMKGKREKQKSIACKSNCKANSKSNCKANVSHVDIEEDKEEERERDKDNRKEDDDKPEHFEAICSAIGGFYNERCLNMPRVKTITENRHKLIREGLRTYTPDDYKELFERASRSKFLRGEVTGFKADFDWLIEPEHMAKVLEGKYEDREEAQQKSKGAEELDEYYKMLENWAHKAEAERLKNEEGETGEN